MRFTPYILLKNQQKCNSDFILLQHKYIYIESRDKREKPFKEILLKNIHSFIYSVRYLKNFYNNNMSNFFNDIEFTTERIIMWSITLIVFIVVTYLTVADLTAPDNLDRGLRPVRTVKKEDKKEK